MRLFCGLHTRLFVEYMATMYGDLFASFTQGFLEDHLATLQCNYIEALMQSCLVSIRQHCNVTFLQPFYKVFREAYGNVARKPVCNTNAKLQKGFPAWLPLNLYAMKMQPYGKKLQPFRNLNFPLGSCQIEFEYIYIYVSNYHIVSFRRVEFVESIAQLFSEKVILMTRVTINHTNN